MLDGEDLDDVDLAHPPCRYTDYNSPLDEPEKSERALMAGIRTPGTPVPSGSAFREDVAPPNESTRFMDPFANRDDLDLDLSRIVDNVMAPFSAAVHFSDRGRWLSRRSCIRGRCRMRRIWPCWTRQGWVGATEPVGAIGANPRTGTFRERSVHHSFMRVYILVYLACTPAPSSVCAD